MEWQIYPVMLLKGRIRILRNLIKAPKLDTGIVRLANYCNLHAQIILYLQVTFRSEKTCNYITFLAQTTFTVSLSPSSLSTIHCCTHMYDVPEKQGQISKLWGSKKYLGDDIYWREGGFHRCKKSWEGEFRGFGPTPPPLLPCLELG